MGVGLVPRHILLTLFLALSLAGFAFPACVDPGQSGCDASHSCCAGMVCQSGTCNSCTCATGLAYCQAPCGGGSECCSGVCSGPSGAKTCMACIAGGADCSSNPGACCGGLTCTSNICGGPQGAVMGSWFDLSLYSWTAIAVIIAASFLGLAYMAGKLFEIQVLDAWVRVELGELMKSIVIAVFCIALIASVNSASSFLTGESGNVITTAQNDMKMLYSDSNALYKNLALVYFNVAKVAGYSYTAGTSMLVFVTISYSASPGAGLSPLLSEVGQALDAVASYMMLAAAQAAFLQFFATASVVMMPVGIFLRSFSFTRRLGATLLAATIAAAVIYPSSIILSNDVYKTFRTDLLASTAKVTVPDAGNPPLTTVVCSEVMKTFINSPIPLIGGENGWHIVVCLPICAILAAIPGAGAGAFTACFQGVCKYVIKIIFAIVKAIFPIIMYASVFITMDHNTLPDTLINNYYIPMQNYGLPAVAQFTVISLFTFLIPIIITLSLLRAIAISFGGEPQLYGLSKLV